MSDHKKEEQIEADIKALSLYETLQGEAPRFAFMPTPQTATCQCANNTRCYGNQKQCYQQQASLVGYNWNFFIFHFSFHKANLIANALFCFSMLQR